MPSADDMAPLDKKAFKNIITMLGAAHGGFAAVLVFGALQDWYYGKCQIALAALAWYGVLGPIAEAMQHGSKPYALSHYLNVCISVSKGECGGKPPKLNYMMLCVGMLVAIGVCAAARQRAARHARPRRARCVALAVLRPPTRARVCAHPRA